MCFLKSADRVYHSKWQCSQLKETTDISWTCLDGEKYSAFLLSSNSKRLFVVKARLWTFAINHRDFLKQKPLRNPSSSSALVSSSPPSLCWVYVHTKLQPSHCHPAPTISGTIGWATYFLVFSPMQPWKHRWYLPLYIASVFKKYICNNI